MTSAKAPGPEAPAASAMPPDGPKFRREPESRRREALISAALDAVAEDGMAGATVRNIAARAGVTAGLIRHYFKSREALMRAAYVQVMNEMTSQSIAASEAAAAKPVARLTAFVCASFRPPVLDSRNLAIWAEFQHAARTDADLAAAHRLTYLAYRTRLETLIEALPRPAPGERRLRAEAIACNAVIDGLWIEGASGPDSFSPGEIERIGLAAIGAILGLGMGGALE